MGEWPLLLARADLEVGVTDCAADEGAMAVYGLAVTMGSTVGGVVCGAVTGGAATAVDMAGCGGITRLAMSSGCCRGRPRDGGQWEAVGLKGKHDAGREKTARRLEGGAGVRRVCWV